MQLSELLHKRILVAAKGVYGNNKEVKELKILEIAPSTNWIKVMNDVGKKYWLHSSDIVPIEVLAHFDKPQSI